MKKRIVSVLLVMALLVPTVTACHDSSKDNQATKDVEATGYNPEEAAKNLILANYLRRIRIIPSKWDISTVTTWLEQLSEKRPESTKP